MRSILILSLLLCLVTGADADRRRALIMKQTVAAADGPNVWYDTVATRDGNVTGDSLNENASPVVFSVAGTATKLRVRIDTFTSSTDVKLALYTTGKVLIGQCAATTVSSLPGGNYLEVNLITPVAVSATTYLVAHECSGAGITLSVDNGTGTIITGPLVYASFPDDPFSGASEFNNVFAFMVGVYVD
jgi:hypothetical protein